MAEGDEDESDLDLAWKTLDVARAIAEKHLGDTLEKVDILSTLAEVSLERGLLMFYVNVSFFLVNCGQLSSGSLFFGLSNRDAFLLYIIRGL